MASAVPLRHPVGATIDFVTISPALEFAVQDPWSAGIALEVGADRVELCSALASTGGLTPSIAMIEAVVAAAIPTHVLIRPRPGGFVFETREVSIMVADALAAIRAGAAGVVVGALTAAGVIDEDALARFVDAANGAEVTFHRAFDVLERRDQALETLISHGVDRVLTSGGAATCAEGFAELGRLATTADGRIEILAGGGVKTEDVASLVAAGVGGIHLSARRAIESSGQGPGGGTAGYDTIDPDLARAVAEELSLRAPR